MAICISSTVSPQTALSVLSSGLASTPLTSLPHALCVLGREGALAGLLCQFSGLYLLTEPQLALFALWESPPSDGDRLHDDFADTSLLAEASWPSGSRFLSPVVPQPPRGFEGADRARALRVSFHAEALALREVLRAVAECLLPRAEDLAGILGVKENPIPSSRVEKRRIPEDEYLVPQTTPSLGIVHSILMAMLD